ncbi:MAG TPA: DinB family protein [Candidatus Dormibacteraeota bacterium]|nr:DinB family protein [Candidatus Dormibacteraeota bacterium]
MGQENTQDTIAAIREGLRGIHKRIRDVVAGLDRDTLNWKPHPDANSIAVLITHTLESEGELLGAVRGVEVTRDRASEFLADKDRDELLGMLDRADAWLAEQTDAMTGADLSALRPRTDNPPKPGLYWLLTSYGHGREHLAHMELTRQLSDARKS